MSDWQVGDLAVCVDASPCQCTPDCGIDMGLTEGRVHRVLRVYRVRGWVNLDVGLPPDPSHGDNGAWEQRFRKIRPDEHQACEPEFVKLLKRAKRPVSA